jgi:hypothetical protein
LKVFKSQGCDRCSHTGYKGRMGIHEIMVVGDEIRKLILASAPAEVIKSKACELGMQTLRQDGWRKVLDGLTTPEELMRGTPHDESTTVKKWTKAEAETEYFVMPGKGSGLTSKDPAERRYEEKRKYVRVKVRLDVIFRPIELDIEQVDEEKIYESWKGRGESENLSAGGIAFQTAESLMPGDILELKMDLEDGQSPIQCIGRVLRVLPQKEKPKEGQRKIYDVGITFLAIHSGDRLRIENYCNR